MHCILNIFKSAGGLAIVDFSYVTEIYKGGCHGHQTINLLHKFSKKKLQTYALHIQYF